LGIDTSVIELKVVQHVGISHSGSQAVDSVVVGLKCSREMVDAGAGGSELLGGDGGASLHCGGEPVHNCMCDFTEFVSTEADEGLS
jgi:hypothetical protein